MPTPTTGDKAWDFGWNVLTGVPGVGTLASATKLGIDCIQGMQDANDPEASAQHGRDMASDAISMIPMVGTATSIAGAAYDVLAPNDTWGNLTNQIMGGSDAYGPDPVPGSKYDPTDEGTPPPPCY